MHFVNTRPNRGVVLTKRTVWVLNVNERLGNAQRLTKCTLTAHQPSHPLPSRS